jgi:hypothetical protein
MWIIGSSTRTNRPDRACLRESPSKITAKQQQEQTSQACLLTGYSQRTAIVGTRYAAPNRRGTGALLVPHRPRAAGRSASPAVTPLVGLQRAAPTAPKPSARRATATRPARSLAASVRGLSVLCAPTRAGGRAGRAGGRTHVAALGLAHERADWLPERLRRRRAHVQSKRLGRIRAHRHRER